MKKRIQYTNEPSDVNLNSAVRIKDFLPSASELVFKNDQAITLRLDENTFIELKKIAKEKGLGVSTLVRMWVKDRISGSQRLGVN